MKQTLSLSDFHDAFIRMDRKENFSREAREILFDYFEEIYPDMELDVIAICCDFYEDSWEDVALNYSIDLSECSDDEEKEEAVREYLEDYTYIVGKTPSGFVYAAL